MGGAPLGASAFYFGSDDFFSSFYVDSAGDVLSGQNNTAVVAYSTSQSQYDTTYDLRVTALSAVPEPATWAMMMLGFGSMGYAMRRKNKVSTRIRFA